MNETDRPDSDWQSTASDEMLLKRALMLRGIRGFFDDRGIIEVETPIMSAHRTTDPHLDSLQARFQGAKGYLNTSPEFAMKRLLARWGRPIYQICKAFRDDVPGPLHNPEFTILEWYRPGFDQQQLMDELEQLVGVLVSQLIDGSGPEKIAEMSPFDRISYQQAFEDSLSINPHVADAALCCRLVEDHKIEIPQGLTVEDSVDDWLDWLLVSSVAPAFRRDRFTFLYDYPASQCSLAKLEPRQDEQLVAKRFELFFGEIEVANAFEELTDAQEQHRRFQNENSLRVSMGKESCETDHRFIAALEDGMPACSGVAVGLDRLLMVLTQAQHIETVIAFPWGRA